MAAWPGGAGVQGGER